MCTITITGRPKGRPRKRPQDGEEGDSPDEDASATDPLNALVCARESGQGRERVCARVRESDTRVSVYVCARARESLSAREGHSVVQCVVVC